MQVAYWRAFFSGKIDEEYVERRRFIDKVHARADLPPETYLAATNFCFDRAIEHVVATSGSESEAREIIVALTKQLNLDTTVVVSTYAQLTREEMTEQSRAIIELSTLVTTIWDRLLLLPIIGIVDSTRALDISSRTWRPSLQRVRAV